jgi:hypothetical protein
MVGWLFVYLMSLLGLHEDHFLVIAHLSLLHLESLVYFVDKRLISVNAKSYSFSLKLFCYDYKF